MTNPALIAHVLDNEDRTECEMELADRLQAAIEELDRLTEALRIAEAPTEGAPSGDDA